MCYTVPVFEIDFNSTSLGSPGGLDSSFSGYEI